HSAREIATDRESEAGTTLPAGSSWIDLHERLENGLRFDGRDADPGVLDPQGGPRAAPEELHVRVRRPGRATAHGDAPTAFRELDGVAQQNHQDLADAICIAQVRIGRIRALRRERDSGRARLRLYQ